MLLRNATVRAAFGLRKGPAPNPSAIDPDLLGNARYSAEAFDDRVRWVQAHA